MLERWRSSLICGDATAMMKPQTRQGCPRDDEVVDAPVVGEFCEIEIEVDRSTRRRLDVIWMLLKVKEPASS
jgi:hypothetical protein